MRALFVPAILVAYSFLAGCASAPCEPTLTLKTTKSPGQYAACVMPKMQGGALNTARSQAQRHYRIVVSSPVTADNVIEAYKTSAGASIFVYERSLLTSDFGRTAQECV